MRSQTRHVYSIIGGKTEQTASCIDVIDPYTKQPVAVVHKMREIPDLKSVRHDFSPRQVRDAVDGVSMFIRKRKNFLARIAAEETGSPIRYHLGDIESVIEHIDSGDMFKRSSQSTYRREPKGKVLLSLSANEPIILTCLPLFSSLLELNVTVVKPSNRAPSISYLIVKELIERGLNPYVLYFVTPDHDQFSKMIASGLTDMVLSFGSSKTNEKLASRAIESGTEFIAENEGNDWMYIDESVDIAEEELIRILLGSFTRHNGQMCDAVRGIFVHEKKYSDIVARLESAIGSIRVGSPLDTDSDIGALLEGTVDVTRSAIKEEESLCEQTLRSIPDGSEVIPATVFIEPAFTDERSPTEFFAPVLWVKKVSGHQEVMDLYHKYNAHGLGFTVFSDTSAVQEALIDGIPAARINLNTDPISISLSSPWGGVGKSGHGGPYSWSERLSNRKLLNYGQY